MSKGTAVVDLGERAPDFTLESSAGGHTTLSEVMGTANTILYFFREFS
jgi:peroxiredoxin